MKRTALFMIMLVLTIPFVIAQDLSITTYAGKDGTNGYARTNDEVTIEALAKIAGEDIIDKEQLRFYIEDSYIFFDKCQKSGEAGYYECEIYEPQFEAYEPIQFRVDLYTDDGNVAATETRTLKIDNIPPIIKELIVEPKISGGPVTVSYVAEDYARSLGDKTECSGFKTITITANGQETQETGETGVCTKSSVVPITLTEGTEQICVVAKDYVNYQSAPMCTSVTIDQSKPKIESFTITDEGNFVLTHVRAGQERTATAHAVITDTGGLDDSTVKANFKELNTNLPDYLPYDEKTGDIYTWTGITVKEVSPCTIKAKATDLLGNTIEENFPCDIKADDTPPTIIGITGAEKRNNIPLYAKEDEIKIKIEDKDNNGNTGIGMQTAQAYLDLSDLGMPDYVEAKSCIKEANAWICKWPLKPTTNEGQFTITLIEGTSDDLGNTIGTPLSYEIIYDNIGPQIPTIIESKVIAGQTGIEYAGGATKGSTVQYTVKSKDFKTATANFLHIGGKEKQSATRCDEQDDGTSHCLFESLVGLTGPYTAQLNFTFYDDAKNKAETTTTLEVYGVEGAPDADYWITPPSITCTPNLIDRDIAKMITPYVSCRIDLQTPPNSNVQTLTVAGPTSPDQCTGDTDLILNDVYVTNNYGDSTNPYLFMILEARNYQYNSININCPIQVFSKRPVQIGEETQYYVSDTPQTLPVNVTIEFYDNPLQGQYNRVNDKIEKAMDNAYAKAEWIGELKKWMAFAEQICYLKGVLTGVIEVLTIVTMYLGITATTLKASPLPPTQAAADATNTVKVNVCNTEEKVSQIYKDVLGPLDSICSLVNCNAVGGKDKGISDYFGGAAGIPWCEDFKSTLGTLNFENVAKESGVNPQGQGLTGADVKESIVLSILCFCVPGIIHNLEELRQLYCFEGVCLNDNVKQQGYPTSFCNEMKNYLVCAYVIGEIFALFPFIKFFDQLINIVVDMIADPVALFTVGLGGICQTACYEYGSVGFGLCALPKTFAVAGEVYAAIEKLQDSKGWFGGVSNNYCARLEEIQDEMEQ